jgi:hypothetical protein
MSRPPLFQLKRLLVPLLENKPLKSLSFFIPLVKGIVSQKFAMLLLTLLESKKISSPFFS